MCDQLAKQAQRWNVSMARRLADFTRRSELDLAIATEREAAADVQAKVAAVAELADWEGAELDGIE